MASMVVPVEQVIHMNGGVGETSYANNSSIPKKVMMRVKPILEESLNNMFCSNVPTCMKVADLGCSSGPNALLVANNIMDIVNETSRRSLPEFYDTPKIKKDTTCLMNATPGTFYGTLFPSNSIHFFHSSYSLHWLSQVPDLLSEEAKMDVTSISASSYAKQFKQDFKLFLTLRSVELVPKGGMLLTFMGRFDTTEFISVPGLIRMILNDMVSENRIEEAKSEDFTVPNYFATADEVREAIQEEGSFSVEKLESIKTSWDGSSLNEAGNNNKSFKDDNERAEFITRNKRSVFEPLLKAHFGEGIMDELFVRFKNKVIQFMPKLEYPILVISLTKIA